MLQVSGQGHCPGTQAHPSRSGCLGDLVRVARTHPLPAPGTVTGLVTKANYLGLHLREVDLDLLVGGSVDQRPAAVRAAGEGNCDCLLDLLLRGRLAPAEPPLAGASGVGLGLVPGEGGRLAAAAA